METEQTLSTQPRVEQLFHKHMGSNERMTRFESDIASVLNSYSIDNCLNTPDFMLAEFISDQLEAFQNVRVDKWERCMKDQAALKETIKADMARKAPEITDHFTINELIELKSKLEEVINFEKFKSLSGGEPGGHNV